MFSRNDDGQQAIALGLVFTLVAMAVLLVVGLGIARFSKLSPRPPGTEVVGVPPVALPQPVASQAVAPPPSAPSAEAISGVTVESGTVRFYFASGSAALASDAESALAGVVKSARAGHNLTISGFHDESGLADSNAALARRRASAVRDALLKAGVPPRHIILEKPVQAAAGHAAEARRVDITVQ
ncbi:MAG: OmpA family protein [Polaromonas sp.]|nr:OmpA family protein [Polaromonas sp.]